MHWDPYIITVSECLGPNFSFKNSTKFLVFSLKIFVQSLFGEEMKLPISKEDRHKNNPDCFDIVPEEVINRDLGTIFEHILMGVNEWKLADRNEPENENLVNLKIVQKM